MENYKRASIIKMNSNYFFGKKHRFLANQNRALFGVNSESNICLTKQEDTFQRIIVIEDNLQRNKAHLQRKLTQ